MADARILLYDLETSLQTAAIFGLANNDWIDPRNLTSERYIISASWKFLGESKVYSVSVLDDPKRYEKDPSDDTYVCKVLHKVMSESDVICGHNGDSFDKPYLETRMLVNGIEPLPPVQSIDTLKVAKSKFRFNSNKLDYLGKLLGVGRKIETKPGLWLEVLQGNKSAIRDMVTYNKQDVLLLERVFLKLRPYMSNHINRELFGQKEGCPKCGSKKVQSRGVHRAISRVYRRFFCNSCSSWFRSVANEKTITTKTRIL